MKYETVIGLEVHVQLNTNTKLFCGCPTQFGAPPNSQTCPVCQGHPGALPVLNEVSLTKAIQAGLSLNCSINHFSKFDRKNYFYPDLPKAYQISQFDLPFCKDGFLEITLDNGESRKIGINRIHMEEDAGKLIHSDVSGVNESYVDLNRCGVPLLEIVTEPDLRSSEEAYHYLTALKSILKYINVSDCNMEEGSLRCDANISLRPVGETKLGTKAEIKNMNSFKGVQKALDYEVKRQSRALDKGERIVQETRLYNVDEDKTYTMRSKEEAHDYRYFPDPDLVPVVLEESFVKAIESDLPELPTAKRERFIKDYKIPESDARVLTESLELAKYYEDAVEVHPANPKKIANWIMAELMRALNEAGGELSSINIKASEIGNLVKHIDEGKISGKMGKSIFEEMLKSGDNVESIIERLGLKLMDNEGEIAAIIDEVIKNNPEAVASYKAGKEKAIGSLVGQVMKATKGQANPATVNKLLKEKLSA
ncbi:MAG: Asp-tRNA(Asn)/Glu-tRNA(Gln) amidotransferase subunit GatB [Spirochaetota bacterium]|nr:Asp-tRNA(Asn)/Glu-tRNA(Gln) amidotransferase subunit GatB [Spirochaetota bacterium]